MAVYHGAPTRQPALNDIGVVLHYIAQLGVTDEARRFQVLTPRLHFAAGRFSSPSEVDMFSTSQLDDLRKDIRDDPAALRIWRDVGDTMNVEKLNDRINLKLDRLRRFSAKTNLH